MKANLLYAFYGAILVTTSTISCKKDSDSQDAPTARNEYPVARAGVDQTITLSECHGDAGVAVLDGSGSSDANGNLKTYAWRRVSGPGGEQLHNATSAKAGLTHLSMGKYVYELTVKDDKLLASKDSVEIEVKGVPKAYDLDLSFHMPYTFIDDTSLCSVDDFFYPCLYDVLQMGGESAFAPMGNLKLRVDEYTEPANMSNTATQQSIRLYTSYPEVSLGGSSSINLKRLMFTGGGPFTGEFKVHSGSAALCNPAVFTSLPPLKVSGSLDPVAKTVRMRVQGKVYF